MNNYAFLMQKSASNRSNHAIRYGPVEAMRAALVALPAALLATHFVAEPGKAYWYAD